MVLGIPKLVQALIKRVCLTEVRLTQGMIDGLVFPLQSDSTHGGNFPRWLHLSIDEKPRSGERRPLLKGREESLVKKQQTILCRGCTVNVH